MKPIAIDEAPGQLSQQLARIFDRHYELMYRTAYSLTGSAPDAEDIVQTIFLRLLNRELPPDLHTAPERYLYRATFNLSLNTIRDKRRQVLTGDMEVFDTACDRSEANAEDAALDQTLQEAIAMLSPAAAQVVILRYVHDYSLVEIARMLGTTRSTVAVSLFRSRSRLKSYLSAARKRGNHGV